MMTSDAPLLSYSLAEYYWQGESGPESEQRRQWEWVRAPPVRAVRRVAASEVKAAAADLFAQEQSAR
jgi:hypothetical protein